MRLVQATKQIPIDARWPERPWDGGELAWLVQQGYIKEAPKKIGCKWFFNYHTDQFELWQQGNSIWQSQWPLMLGSFSKAFVQGCPNSVAMTCLEEGWPFLDQTTLLRIWQENTNSKQELKIER